MASCKKAGGPLLFWAMLLKRLLFPFLCACSVTFSVEDCDTLFQELDLIEKLDREGKETLPFIYNYSMIGGYFNMPSGRLPKEAGVGAFGYARVHPYGVYGASFQYFDRIEISANYRIFTGMLEPVMGKDGYGDDAERIANCKFALNLPQDGFPEFPTVAVGADDFLGTKRFSAQYIVITKQWLPANLETTVGWGRKRLKGFFGGLSWTPWRQSNFPVLKDLTFMAEYDAIDYENHVTEHHLGRDLKSRINAGLSYILGDRLQLSVSSLRGKHLGASGSLNYPFGTSEGFFKKSENPPVYRSPIDTEPLGVTRPSKEFAHELAYSLGMQGLDLYRVYLKDPHSVWIKIVNNRYRQEFEVRERLQRVLAAIAPSNITTIEVVVEADGISSQSYRFRTEDLYNYRKGVIGNFEMMTLSPMIEPIASPSIQERLFRRSKPIWTVTFRPRFLSFFGSSYGKFKYNLALIATPEGYLFDDLYYLAQVSYQLKTSMYNLNDMDRINPSQLINVRTDMVRYYQTNTASLEMAYLQKGWSFGKGFYGRVAGGYFEPAYGGLSTEFIYYPVGSDWAIGVEEATVMKRRYHGVGFTRNIRKLKNFTPTYEHFIGVQYFLDLYYTFKPLDLDFKVMAGQFLAKDKGARFEMTRWFRSGLQMSLWYTVTNGHDHVNGHTYYDKGFMFVLPLDFFLRQSSRNFIGYGMSAWLRDVGAFADSGRRLYPTLRLERAYSQK